MGRFNANCVRCFFEIQRKLLNLGTAYEQKYGLMPELKAGIHYGDVLNTTARIQEQ